MTFDDVFAETPIGAVLAVSNGQPKPPAKQALKLKVWASHNFSGPLQAKLGATDERPRRLKIGAVDEPGLSVSFEIAEGLGHSFTLLDT